MGMGMKSLKWEGIGTKNLFPHTSNDRHARMNVGKPVGNNEDYGK